LNIICMKIIFFTITVVLILGNRGLAQTSRRNPQAENSVKKQSVGSLAADRHVTINRSNKQWKTNTTLGMFRGKPNKTDHYKNLDTQDQIYGDGSDSSQDGLESPKPLKKKKSFWEKFKFLQDE